jgi:hypothetical protein
MSKKQKLKQLRSDQGQKKLFRRQFPAVFSRPCRPFTALFPPFAFWPGVDRLLFSLHGSFSGPPLCRHLAACFGRLLAAVFPLKHSLPIPRCFRSTAVLWAATLPPLSLLYVYFTSYYT